MKKQEVLKIIEKNKAHLKRFNVNALFLFGSVAHDQAGPDSDIDILVEFDQDAKIGLFEMARLKKFISEILNCDADLVTPDALHPMLRYEILKEMVRVRVDSQIDGTLVRLKDG
ncbi:MAG: nucleotidyltransferase [Deltaproteobacteria bacterium]|nr:MAG: nucleotidyltransferase [Deltaproteobacteria bacterium]